MNEAEGFVVGRGQAGIVCGEAVISLEIARSRLCTSLTRVLKQGQKDNGIVVRAPPKLKFPTDQES